MKILVVAPHPDDEILGCGGIIAKNVAEGNEVYICVFTKGYSPLFDEKEDELDRIHCLNSHKLLGVTKTIFLDFPAAQLEKVDRYQMNGKVCEMINSINPDEVYIPHRGDIHIDHKMVVDSCIVALRPRNNNSVKRIYAYETLSETDWDIPNTTNAFIPNVFVDVTSYIDKKLDAMSEYKGQLLEYPSPRSLEGIRALAMHRGSTVNKRYAESFMLIRDIK